MPRSKPHAHPDFFLTKIVRFLISSCLDMGMSRKLFHGSCCLRNPKFVMKSPMNKGVIKLTSKSGEPLRWITANNSDTLIPSDRTISMTAPRLGNPPRVRSPRGGSHYRSSSRGKNPQPPQLQPPEDSLPSSPFYEPQAGFPEDPLPQSPPKGT